MAMPATARDIGTPPALALTVRDIKARAVIAPLARPLRNAMGIIPAAPLVLIDLATEEGVDGRSYIFGYTPPTLRPLVRFIEEIAPELKGKPVAPADRLNDFDRRFRLLGWQGLVGMAVSGIDMALWDALARALDLPVVALLGGKPTPVPAYDSFGAIDPEKDAGAIEDSVERGFRAIKIKVGEGDLAADVRMVSGVRKLIGPDVALMVDYNQSLDPVEARRRIARLAEFDLTWVEEPVPADDLSGHAQVRSGSPIPIQTGENWWFPRNMANAIAARACDYAMPDVMKIGGVTGWMRAAALAEAASTRMSSHIFVETNAHLLPVTPTAHLLEHLDIAGAVLADPAQAIDGNVTARGPGLGIDWNEKAVERHAV